MKMKSDNMEASRRRYSSRLNYTIVLVEHGFFGEKNIYVYKGVDSILVQYETTSLEDKPHLFFVFFFVFRLHPQCAIESYGTSPMGIIQQRTGKYLLIR